ncbi:MAG TPA: hypothetical protein VIR16_09095 [Candidatus Limnocylindrales bacterium]
MELARRTRWIAYSLPIALVAVAALPRPAPPGVLAAAGMAGERACAATGEAAGHGEGAAGGATAWYRLETVLDADGTLAARHLVAGRGAGRWTAELPPESFASGPVAGRLLVGDDDGHRSRLRLLDTVRGCWSAVGTEDSVIRSALLASDGHVYEHRVDRATRRDLGVWARELASPEASRPVLGGLDADPASGPTFSTTLLLGEGGRIAVSSCGERACRTRVVDPESGAASPVVRAGPAAAIMASQLVALEPCEGLPCPMLVVNLATGATTSVGPVTGMPVSPPDASGVLVVAGDHGLRVGRTSDPLHLAEVPGTQQLAPIPRTSTSETGFEAPRGLVAVAPGGSAADPSLVRLLDPAALKITAGEVLP